MRLRSLLLLGVVLAGVLGTGCDEISARRKIQEANDEYKNGRYEEARDLYEAALKKSPDLAIGHHNLGVTYYKIMRRGMSKEDEGYAENQLIADKAAHHLEMYLKSNPKDDEIRKLITDIWVDTDQVDKALAFWTKEHDADPANTEALEQLADLNYKRGDWRQAIHWFEVAVDVAKTPEAKASAYTKIGSLCYVKLLNNKEGPDKIDGVARIELADIGIAALQKGQAIQPKSTEIISVLGSLNVQRGIASGSRLGYAIDMAAYQNYMRIFGVLASEAAKAPPAEAPPGQGS